MVILNEGSIFLWEIDANVWFVRLTVGNTHNSKLRANLTVRIPNTLLLQDLIFSLK